MYNRYVMNRKDRGTNRAGAIAHTHFASIAPDMFLHRVTEMERIILLMKTQGRAY